jgi:hypothetical protein
MHESEHPLVADGARRTPRSTMPSERASSGKVSSSSEPTIVAEKRRPPASRAGEGAHKSPTPPVPISEPT